MNNERQVSGCGNCPARNTHDHEAPACELAERLYRQQIEIARLKDEVRSLSVKVDDLELAGRGEDPSYG